MRNLVTLADLTATEIERVFSITEDLKNKFGQGPSRAASAGACGGLVVREAIVANAG